MYIKKIIIILLGVCFFQSLLANSIEKVQIHYKSKKNFLNFSLSTKSSVINRENSNLRNLFDRNKTTTWYTKSLSDSYMGGKPSLIIEFNEKVYVSGLRILPCNNTNDSALIGFVVDNKISSSNAWDLSNFYKIINKDEFQYINFIHGNTKGIYNFFPTKRIVIEILQSSNFTSDMCISEIELNLEKKLNYNPRFSFQEVKSYIKNNSNYFENKLNWSFTPRNSVKLNKQHNDIFVDLTYYAVMGNQDAQKIFYSSTTTVQIEDIYKPLLKEMFKN